MVTTIFARFYLGKLLFGPNQDFFQWTGYYDSRGSTAKLYTIWLYYMPEAPLTPEAFPTLSSKPVKKETKKAKVEAESKVNEEIK